LIASIAPAAGRLISAVSWSTRTPGGFTDAQLQALLATLVYFAPLLDTHAAQRIGGGLLKVYLGANAGSRVIEGAVRRGDGGEIRAAICFTDLRGFTSLSDRLPRAELLELLNSYFDCVVAAVHAHGGEVLKFIGDAVLAIFRVADNTDAAANVACQAALQAAHDAFTRGAAANLARPGRQPIEFGTAIHIGDVEYGNIGAADRLDFTVIGPAVNLASRLQGLCRTLGQPLLVSEAFAQACSESCNDLGDHQLKGVAAVVKVFAPTPR
jgi:adenylate cyclase